MYFCTKQEPLDLSHRDATSTVRRNNYTKLFTFTVPMSEYHFKLDKQEENRIKIIPPYGNRERVLKGYKDINIHLRMNQATLTSFITHCVAV